MFDPAQYATPDDIAAAINEGRAAGETVSVETVRRHCRQGVLPAVRVGRSWLVHERDAAKYVTEYEPYKLRQQ